VIARWPCRALLICILGIVISCDRTSITRLPVASAGANQQVHVGESAALNGSGSSDPNGAALAFHWSFDSRPAGSTADLYDSTTVGPRFTPDRAGEYTVSLVVSNGRTRSPPNRVTVTALHSEPTANAGADRTVRTGDSVTLDGRKSADPNGDALTF